MQISIVTPSFRSSKWLKLCVASVADQGVNLEHIVQDACSDDGTQDWLSKDPRVRAYFEKDQGMYDAINRGLRRTQGKILAHLNCDEQYLPGALARVLAHFETHPELDIVFADTLVVDPHGEYICERRALTPQKYHSMISGNLSFLTAATFFRRRVIDEHGIFFSTWLKTVGDVDWALRIVNKKLRMAVLPKFTSVFTETESNLSQTEMGIRERQEMFAAAPWWARTFNKIIVGHFRLRRMCAGHYSPRRCDYAIYTLTRPDRRHAFQVDRPRYRWVR